MKSLAKSSDAVRPFQLESGFQLYFEARAKKYRLKGFSPFVGRFGIFFIRPLAK